MFRYSIFIFLLALALAGVTYMIVRWALPAILRVGKEEDVLYRKYGEEVNPIDENDLIENTEIPRYKNE